MLHEKRGLAYPLLLSAISHLLCAFARPYHRGVTSGVTVSGDLVFSHDTTFQTPTRLKYQHSPLLLR